MLILRLALNELLQRKVRSALTALAIAMAVSLVVAMTSGFASLKLAGYKVLGSFYGNVDVSIAPQEDRGKPLRAEFAETLRADPRVATLEASLTAYSPLLDSWGFPASMRSAQLVGTHIDPQNPPSGRKLVSGEWFTQRIGAVAVIDESIAQRLGLRVGSFLRVPHPNHPLRLKIVGLVPKPSVIRIDAPIVYLPLATLQSWLGQIGAINRIDIALQHNIDPDAFAADLAKHLPEGTPPLDIKTKAVLRERVDRNGKMLDLASYLGGTVSLVAAAFIIFTTLSMGVTERTRILAMLRAIGAVRGQIVALVLIEGLLLAILGALLGAVVGVAGVWWLATVWAPKVFVAGYTINIFGVAYAVFASVATALVASLLPAWSAGRVDTLEALASVSKAPSSGVAGRAALAGLLLLCIDPAVAFAPNLDRTFRLWTHLILGVPALLVGLFLVSPLIVVAVERTLGQIIARLFGLQPALLRQQLSGAIWRASGTAAALMVGLAVFTVLQTHMRSLLSGWNLPDKFPDMLIFAPAGLDAESIAKLETTPGIRPGGLMPVMMVSPKVGADIFGIGGISQMPDATILFGLDPERAFGTGPQKAPPMIELEYIEGDALSATAKLKQGHAVLVSQEFQQIKHLHLGDTLKFQTPLHGEVAYTIAGVVRSAGVDVIARLFSMEREMQQWTASATVTTLDDVRRDFGAERIQLFGANVDLHGDKKQLEEAVHNRLRVWGLLSADARSIKQGIDKGFSTMIDLASVVAMTSMIVAAVGVANAIIAGIRTRRWQLGVLRSIGLTRGGLLRLVLVEALLIGAIAVVVGIGGGLLLSLDANRMAVYVVGLDSRIIVPWPTLGLGAAITLGVALVASLWPAVSVSRADTLELLKAGRAAA
jgi:putative ABC transport system permease protein